MGISLQLLFHKCRFLELKIELSYLGGENL